jgi:hypothetical protein
MTTRGTLEGVRHVGACASLLLLVTACGSSVTGSPQGSPSKGGAPGSGGHASIDGSAPNSGGALASRGGASASGGAGGAATPPTPCVPGVPGTCFCSDGAIGVMHCVADGSPRVRRRNLRGVDERPGSRRCYRRRVLHAGRPVRLPARGARTFARAAPGVSSNGSTGHARPRLSRYVRSRRALAAAARGLLSTERRLRLRGAVVQRDARMCRRGGVGDARARRALRRRRAKQGGRRSDPEGRRACDGRRLSVTPP